jgi:hypothetical protein
VISKTLLQRDRRAGAPLSQRSNGHALEVGMKAEIVLGLILVALASIVFYYEDLSHTFLATRIVGAAAQKTMTLPLDPVFTQLALAGGIVLLVVGLKKSFIHPRGKTKVNEKMTVS